MPKNKVSCFEPKRLNADLDRKNMRYSMLGAVAHGHYHELAAAPTSLCKVVWEAVSLSWRRVRWQVKLTTAIPAVLTPQKPKAWLMFKLHVPAKTAVKL